MLRHVFPLSVQYRYLCMYSCIVSCKFIRLKCTETLNTAPETPGR